MRIDTAVLLYPGCIFLEIAAAVDLLAAHGTVRYFTPDGGPHRASNGATISADASLAALVDSPPRCVVVPGGNPGADIDPSTATPCLVAAHDAGALLAGISAGSLVLARTGLLRGRRVTHDCAPGQASPEVVAQTALWWEGSVFEHADVVVDGPFITAQHWARDEFAGAIAQALGIGPPPGRLRASEHLRSLILLHWALANERRWVEFGRLLHADLRYQVPQTREYIESGAGYLEMFRTWPGDWTVTVVQLVCEEGRAVCVVDFAVGADTMTGISIFELTDGLISRVTDYWPEPYEPPPRATPLMKRHP